METRTYNFFADGGHGWLEVPLEDVRAVGVWDSITTCSYVKSNYAYLEEDCDASAFVRAVRAAGWRVNFLDHYVDGDSIIRRYKRFPSA
jgi:hypothetical protein